MAKMAGKPSSIPACFLHRSILAFDALIVLSFSMFSIKSLRYLAQIQNQYNSHLTLSNFLTDNLKLSFDGSHSVSSSSIYHSPQNFSASYAESERKFNVYIYPDGDPKTNYQTPRKLTGKYTSEGYFFQNIRESMFHTEDPNQADLSFIPIFYHKLMAKDNPWSLGWPSKFQDKSYPRTCMGKCHRTCF